jgi:protein-S-isoprenylcysteine O-methyltransferase Ste14
MSRLTELPRVPFAIGRLHGAAAWIANALLLAQFPLLHSWLLTARGRRVLARLVPHGPTLAPTVFATVAAWQILATFLLWSPSHVVLWEATGAARAAFAVAFALSWVFLGKALFDAGLGLQTGSIGWMALWRGERPRYPGMPERGLFAACRQPIYLGFALLLWTGPVWTRDHLVLAVAWSAYCALGPLFKEERFARIHGAAFEAYRARTRYLLPLPRRRMRA